MAGGRVHAPASGPFHGSWTGPPPWAVVPFPGTRPFKAAFPARRRTSVRVRCRGRKPCRGLRRSGAFRRDRARRSNPPCGRASGAGLLVPSPEQRRRPRPSAARSGRAPSAGQGGALAVPGPASLARRLKPRFLFIGWSSETRTHTRQAGRISPLPHSALDPGSEPFDPYPGPGAPGTAAGPEAPALPAEPPAGTTGGGFCSDTRHSVTGTSGSLCRAVTGSVYAEPNPIKPNCRDNPTDMPQGKGNRAKWPCLRDMFPYPFR